jgi:asparagine synthase (glutamine-hydrolysing)
MCGIAGFLDRSRTHSAEELKRIALRMADTLRHRGPDDGGAWADPNAGIVLSMRRLAILDLSPAGHQPMQSPSGRYEIVFNGEIYNCEDLRRELLVEDPALAFFGHSDTEVMLAAFDQWGMDKAVGRFNGMFAFALWDRQKRNLTLGRDRFGEKPLYYAVVGGRFLFGSELKALRAHPEFMCEIDLGAVALYLRHNCIPAPYSIYTIARKLPPATLLTVSVDDFTSMPCTYWSAQETAEAGGHNLFAGSESDAVEALDALLRDAVKIRMYSDVPLGAFLSGGIDSSTIAALMQAQSSIPVKTFSIGQLESEYDEAPEASVVARHLQTDHTELYVTPRQAMSVVPRLPQMFDEPFADSSQIPTFLVSQLARQQVTVSLSGDGGDEIFGGYNRHTWGGPLWRKLKPVPHSLRRLGASTILALSPEAWDTLFRNLGSVLPRSWRQRVPGYKLHKLASVMDSRDAYDMYCTFTSHWPNPSQMLAGVVEPPTLLTDGNLSRLPSATEQMMYLDSVTYLPDDILVKLDRATMAVSLEGRIPLLDHRVAEFSWRLPLSMRVRGRVGKWILRQVLYRYVPRELVERPKFGFGIPLASWLRAPLHDWAEGLLDEGRLRREGIFDPKPIRHAWKEHLAGQRHWEFHLWDVLMFQAWLEESQRTNNFSASSIEAESKAIPGCI